MAMKSGHFQIREHKIPAGHIREYAGSTSTSQNEVLHLHVKQYTPLDQPNPLPENAVTVIATHGLGLPKELYEPLWDELFKQSKIQGLTIRGIWIADVANMGMSGVFNEEKISNDASWMDHARDLLLMINHFREEMPRPIVGIGHSFGGCQITNLAYIHPRLFTTLILLDPVIQLSPPPMGFGNDPPGGVNQTTYRRDLWPTRSAAAASQAKASRAWDPRVVSLMIQYGYRDLPTALYPDLPADSNSQDPAVTITTTKHQAAVTHLRENFSARRPDGRIKINRETHADIDPLAAFVPLYRPEPRSTYRLLPSLRPSVLWVLGEKTNLRIDEIREGIKTTGTGIGGSGGVQEGKVKEVNIKKRGHLFPFEVVEETAKECGKWLGEALEEFGNGESLWNKEREKMSPRDHMVTTKKWLEVVKPVSSFKNKL